MPSSAQTSGDEELAKARWEALNLVQWLARVANSFVSSATPEERIALVFHVDRAALVTPTFGNGLSLELRLPTLEMQFRSGDAPTPHVFDPQGHSPAEVEAWLLVELLHRGLDCAKFSKALPYDTSHLMAGDAEDHSPRSCGEGLARLTSLLRDAAGRLASAQAAPDGKGRVTCWPQTLALALVSNESARTAQAGSFLRARGTGGPE